MANDGHDTCSASSEVPGGSAYFDSSTFVLVFLAAPFQNFPSPIGEEIGGAGKREYRCSGSRHRHDERSLHKFRLESRRPLIN